jgi:hypothetical protein
MVVPFAAGGPTDAIARVIAEQMRSSLGQPVIIENVSGADGSIGTGRVARARPDGYTIELGLNSTHVLNGALYSLPYDVLNDFAPITPLVTLSGVLFARTTVPAKDLNELIAWLKANPNKASAGIGWDIHPPDNRILSERNRHAIYARALSWQRPCNAGPAGGSDRPVVRHTGSAAADAGRKHQSLCGVKRDAFRACT